MRVVGSLELEGCVASFVYSWGNRLRGIERRRRPSLDVSTCNNLYIILCSLSGITFSSYSYASFS